MVKNFWFCFLVLGFVFFSRFCYAIIFDSLPKLQNSNLQIFDIQRKSLGQSIVEHFLITEIKVCLANIVNSLRKVTLTEQGFEWPISMSEGGKSKVAKKKRILTWKLLRCKFHHSLYLQTEFEVKYRAFRYFLKHLFLVHKVLFVLFFQIRFWNFYFFTILNSKTVDLTEINLLRKLQHLHLLHHRTIPRVQVYHHFAALRWPKRSWPQIKKPW